MVNQAGSRGMVGGSIAELLQTLPSVRCHPESHPAAHTKPSRSRNTPGHAPVCACTHRHPLDSPVHTASAYNSLPSGPPWEERHGLSWKVGTEGC